MYRYLSLKQLYIKNFELFVFQRVLNYLSFKEFRIIWLSKTFQWFGFKMLLKYLEFQILLHPSFSGIRVTRSLVFSFVFYRSSFIHLSCLSFCDLLLLINPLVSSD
jgi:hypothetical protein